ncbi:MAG: hypothetical protein F2735_00315 [Actinobacteria bacterium]|uniref:Unannotated protein n=1 Tax=freshwater metagenome TaxID=449393 RepID=A0A6J6WL62_9ZZZZ|nr:hypothetical protein [Actinomycetota bacterium]
MPPRAAKKYTTIDTIEHHDGLIALRDLLTNEITAAVGTDQASSVAALARQLQSVITELALDDSHPRLCAIRDCLNAELALGPSPAAVAAIGRQVQSVLGAISTAPQVSNVPDHLERIAMQRERRRAGNPMTEEEIKVLRDAADAEEARLRGDGRMPSKVRELEARRAARFEAEGVDDPHAKPLPSSSTKPPTRK